MISKGMVRYIAVQQAAAGAGATAVNLAPGVGKQWIILSAVAFHADDNARSCEWYLTDPVANGPIGLSVSLNPNVALPIGALAAAGAPVVLGPLKATADRYYTFLFAASAAGKIGYVRAVVEEFGGFNDA